jgi:hypothetical protein
MKNKVSKRYMRLLGWVSTVIHNCKVVRDAPKVYVDGLLHAIKKLGVIITQEEVIIVPPSTTLEWLILAPRSVPLM